MDRERLSEVKYRIAVLLTVSPPAPDRRRFRLLYLAGAVASIGMGLAVGWLLSATRPTGADWVIVGLVFSSPFTIRFVVSIFTLAPFLTPLQPGWSKATQIRVALGCVAVALVVCILVAVLTH